MPLSCQGPLWPESRTAAIAETAVDPVFRCRGTGSSSVKAIERSIVQRRIEGDKGGSARQAMDRARAQDSAQKAGQKRSRLEDHASGEQPGPSDGASSGSVAEAPLTRRIANEANVSRESAVRAVNATLSTLRERISAGEAEDVAANLPEPVAELLRTPRTAAEQMGTGDFVNRVAMRAGVSTHHAEKLASTTLSVLAGEVGPEEARRLGAQLPEPLAAMLSSS